MRSKFLQLLLILAAMLALLTCPAMAAEATEITIIHTNDVHGHVDVEPYVAAMTAELRAEGKNVALVSAGDALDGTSFTNADGGLAMATVMGKVGYDCFVLGNHEQNMLRDSAEELAADLQALNCPVLAANADESLRQQLPLIQDYVLRTYGDVKVAFIGLTTAYDGSSDYVAALDAAHDSAAAEGAAVYVAVTHVGNIDEDDLTNNSKYLAQQCPWLDLIIDSHDHAVYEEGIVENGVLIVETGEYANNIGVVTLSVLGDGTVSAKAKLVPQTSYEKDVVADAEVADLVQQYREEQAYLYEVICQIPADLDGERSSVRSHECNLGDVTCDAILWATGADFTTVSGTFLRASVSAGDYTNADRLTTFLSEMEIVTMKKTGQEIWDMLEGVVDAYGLGGRGFSQIGGVRLVFDPSRPVGSRLQSVVMSNGEALELDKVYTYAAFAMDAQGGDKVEGVDYWTQNEDGVPFGTIPQAFVDYINSGEAGDCQCDGRFALEAELEEGQTWNVDATYSLDRLTMAKGSSVAGPAYMTLDGAFAAAEPGKTYAGNIVMNAVTAYDDVSGSAGEIYYLTAKGILQGYNGSFRPQDELTYGDLLLMLYRISGCPETEADSSVYYGGALAWASEAGLVELSGGFDPSAAVTGQNAAQILASWLGDTAAVEDIGAYKSVTRGQMAIILAQYVK